MKCLFLCIIMFISNAVAEQVWEYPFDGLGADWTYEYWEDTGDGAVYDVSISGKGGTPGTRGLPMTSGTLLLPDETDSVTIEISTTWDHSGITMDAGVTAEMEIKAILNGYFHYMFNKTDSHSSWEAASFHESDTEICILTLPCNGGDELELEFTGSLSGYGYIYNAHLIWSVYDMYITAYGDSVAMERTTWADIKSVMF